VPLPTVPSGSTAAPTSIAPVIIPPLFSHPTVDFPIIKHIPKSARPSCCTHLTSVLNDICRAPNEIPNWSKLLDFGRAVLRKPARGGKRHNLTSLIKKRTDEPTTPASTPSPYPNPKLKSDPSSSLAAAVSAKLEDGNIKAALRIICSDDRPAPSSDENFVKLLDKHPAATPRNLPLPDSRSFPALQVEESDVLKAIKSFPAGSSGGPDGVRPQHILELVNCQESGASFLSATTAFINLLLDGKCHPDVAQILFGGSLIALEKKSGGIRPIAIGYTWRRIAAKCANSFACAQTLPLLSPLQLGVAVSGGCEAAIHATRRFVENMPAGHVVAKLDFSNAFNSLHRDAMLESVCRLVPEIYRFCSLSYDKPSLLKFGSHSILSQVGAQQGDPLGPLLFCLTIHPLLTSLSCEMTIGYLDDISLGGTEASVESAVEKIRSQGSSLGLSLNVSKCELISHSGSSNASGLKDFIHILPKEATLLGAPLSNSDAMDKMLASRCEDLERAISRLKLLSAHDSLTLLRFSFSAPKIMHTLRSSPCANHPSLVQFDALLRSGTNLITNSNLSDIQWIQASLPVSAGGLGIRRVTALAPSAFLASAACTHDLQALILSGSNTPADTSLIAAQITWSSAHNQPFPTLPAALKQAAWDKPSVTADAARVLADATNPIDKARIFACSAPHSGDWLHALPISNCGLRLDDEAIRIAVGLRLGTNLCQSHACPCGAQVDARGIHGLSCRKSAGRLARHHHINDLIYRALVRAGVPSTKEPSGLLRSDGKRPDGLTLIPWQCGKSLTWDVTVADTLAASHLPSTSLAAAGAAELAASKKETKYASLSQSHIFVPIACETLGPFSRAATTFLKELGRRLSSVSGDPRETSFFFQRISIAIQRFNCVCFKGSFIQSPDPEG